MRILLSSAKKYLGPKRVAFSWPQQLFQVPVSASHYTVPPSLRMSLRQHSISAPNGVTRPLALADGAPLRVKNSLSKEKVWNALGMVYNVLGGV